MIVPSYEDLQKSTQELIKTFNLLAKRYKPHSYSDLREQVKKLEEEYRKNVKNKATGVLSFFTNTTADAKRLDQIACITQLEQSLSKDKKEEKETNKDLGILLGSLFYRFLRLDEVYDGYVAIATSTKNCALFTTLKPILRLSETNNLDAMTVFDCLSAYWTYLKQEKIASTYGYIKRDEVDFFEKLQGFIKANEKDASLILTRIEYLKVIQNIDAVLINQDKQLRLIIPNIIKELKQAMGDKDQLSVFEISEFWKAFAKELKPCEQAVLQKVMIHSTPIQKEDLEPSTPNTVCSLEILLRKRLETYNQQVLFGAYVVTFEKFRGLQYKHESLEEKLDTALVGTLKLGLNLDPTTTMDQQTERLGFSYLQHFLKIPGIAEQIDTGPWKGVDMLEGFIVTTMGSWDKENSEKQTLKL